MKKILVVLLVLAVATGVFAQEGEWSLGGNVEIGAFVDFSQQVVDKIITTGSTYNLPYNGWGPIHGTINVAYSRDALKADIDFSTTRDELLRGQVQYDAGNYALLFQSNLFEWAGSFWERPNANGYGGPGQNNMREQRLWGYYKLLNEMVTLEAAYASRDNGDGLWTSDTTGAFVKYTKSKGAFGGSKRYSIWPDDQWSLGHALNEQPWATNKSFAFADRDNYLLADVNLSNLEFGVRLPNVFMSHGGDMVVDLLKDTMKSTLIGLKFNMQPVEVAAQFQMGQYGVYFGGRWFIGPVTVGLSFSGILDPDDPQKKMRFGGGVEYNPGVFGAWVKAFYALDGTKTDRDTQIGIEPGFFYNVIPSHLQFRTSVGFYFTGGKTSGEKDALDVGWGVQPELFWNFLGTGAGSYWAYGTGMIVRYRLLADNGDKGMGKTNALDVNFKFSF